MEPPLDISEVVRRFSSEVWGFINEAAARMRAAGKDVGPPPAHLAGQRVGTGSAPE